MPFDVAAFDVLIEGCAQRFMSAPREALALAQQARAGLPPEAPARCRVSAAWAVGLAGAYAGAPADGLQELYAALALLEAQDTALGRAEPALFGRVLRALSIGSELLGALDDALAWGERAAAAARASADDVALADALLSCAVALSRAGQAERGLEQYAQVLALHEAAGRRQHCVAVLNNMGINHKNLGHPAEALSCFERSIACALETGQPGLVAVVRSNLPETLALLDRLDEAHACAEQAAAELAASGHRSGELHARVVLGRLELERGEPARALLELERALEIEAATGIRNHSAKTHLTLAELHKAGGRFEAALHHLELGHAAERAQFSAESDRKLRVLQVQHELASARHDATQSRLRGLEIEQAHAELQHLHAALLESDRSKTRLLARLAELSSTDALTGLANRRQLDERLADELARVGRHGGTLALAMCDVDFFKRINDGFGHAVGDMVLRELAALLRRHCRATDFIARYGGEEFCILLLDADADAAAPVCDALRASVAAHDWAALHVGLTVTLSVGVTDTREAVTAERLLALADRQLYDAKHRGKNRVCWPGMQERMRA